MYLGFRPLPSELPFLHKRSAPRFVLVRLKQESRVSKIIDIISPPSSRLKRFWTTDEKRTQKITRSLDKTKICPVTTPCFYKDRSHFRKFQWDLQYFPCDLRYVTESSLFIWRLGSRAEVSVHAWRGSTVSLWMKPNTRVWPLNWKLQSSTSMRWHVLCTIALFFCFLQMIDIENKFLHLLIPTFNFRFSVNLRR